MNVTYDGEDLHFESKALFASRVRRRWWAHRWVIRRYDWHHEDAYLDLRMVTFHLTKGPTEGRRYRVTIYGRLVVEASW